MLLFKFLSFAFILGFILYLVYHFLGAIVQMVLIGVITIITLCTLFYALFI